MKTIPKLKSWEKLTEKKTVEVIHGIVDAIEELRERISKLEGGNSISLDLAVEPKVESGAALPGPKETNIKERSADIVITDDPIKNEISESMAKSAKDIALEANAIEDEEGVETDTDEPEDVADEA